MEFSLAHYLPAVSYTHLHERVNVAVLVLGEHIGVGRAQLRRQHAEQLLHGQDVYKRQQSGWYKPAVDFAQASGLMAGIGDGKFAPTLTTTRAMVDVYKRQVFGSVVTGAFSASSAARAP